MHRDGRAINAPHPLHIVNDEIAANNGAYVIVTERDRWYFEKASRPIAVSPLLA